MDFEKYDYYQARLGAIGDIFYSKAVAIADTLNETEATAFKQLSLEMKYSLEELAQIISFAMQYK